MYTDCKDPNCVKCKQASKGQSSEEENQCKIPETVGQSSEQGNQCKIPETVGQSSEEESRWKLQKTVEEVIAKDLLFAVMVRGDCLSTCRRMKEEVHCEINALINILRERELNLCVEIEREYSAQVQKIDHDITVNCVDKIMKRYDENKRPPSKTTLVYNSDFDALKRKLRCFGQLRYEDTKELNKKGIQELRETGKMCNQFRAGTEDAFFALPSACSFEVDSKTTSWAKNAASANPFEVANLAEHRIKNEVKRKEMEREVEEQSRRLKEICLGSKEDLKIKFKDELSVDLQTKKHAELLRHIDEQFHMLKKTEPKLNEDDSKINFDDELPESRKTMSEEEKRIRRCQIQLRRRQEKDKEFQPKLEALRRKLDEFAAILEKEEMSDRIYFSKNYFPIEKCGEDNLSGKDLRNKRACYLPSTRKDEPETLSAQIRKRFESIANRTMEGQKREEMAFRSFESTDPVPNKEVGKDNSSLQEKDGQFQSQEELMKTDLEKLWPKLSVTSLKRDKITSQSSESTDSLPSEEVEKDSSLDEDDIEIISRIETESIPSDLSFSPPLPPKNRFKFGPKPLRFASFMRKKGERKPPHSPRNSAKAESSGIGESESQESSLSCAVSSGSNTEMKENPSFNEQPDQESSSECLGDSKDVGEGNNPSVALRSSFSKYLEKNPKNEWLAPHERSEQLLRAGNGSKERVVVKRVVPIFVQELDQWLPRETTIKMASDWLCPAHM